MMRGWWIALIILVFAVLISVYSEIDPVSVYEPEVDLVLNRDLNSIEHIFADELNAPEDVAISANGTIYLSLGDGQIVTADTETSEWRPFTRTGASLESCGSLASEPDCGRPLGLKFVSARDYTRYLSHYDKQVVDDQVLIVADAYKGLLLVDAQGNVISLVQSVEGRKIHFANALAIAQNGSVYFSDSSARFQRNQVLYEVLESQPTGRIIAFNPKTNISYQVATHLPFPNGIALSNNDQTLFIALTTRYKIIQLDLQTKTSSTLSHFAGIPDNIHLHDGVLWVGSVLEQKGPV